MSAGISTLTPISTRLLFVSIPSFLQISEIHFEPERPVAKIKFLHLKVDSFLLITSTLNISDTFDISLTSVLNLNSTLSFKRL